MKQLSKWIHFKKCRKYSHIIRKQGNFRIITQEKSIHLQRKWFVVVVADIIQDSSGIQAKMERNVRPGFAQGRKQRSTDGVIPRIFQKQSSWKPVQKCWAFPNLMRSSFLTKWNPSQCREYTNYSFACMTAQRSSSTGSIRHRKHRGQNPVRTLWTEL